MKIAQCKLVSQVYVQDENGVTGTCLGVWDSYTKAVEYSKKATATLSATHKNLTAVVVDTVVSLDYKAQ